MKIKNICRVSVLCVVFGLIQGCGGCDDYVEAGIVIEIRDAETKDFVCGVEATIHDGEYLFVDYTHYGDADTCGESRIRAAEERVGIYDIELKKEGYVTWVREDVEVIKPGRCHVLTTNIEAFMEREG